MPNPYGPAVVGANSSVPDFECVGPGVLIMDNVRIGHETIIGKGAVIMSDVVIGPRVRIGTEALLLSGALICPDDVDDRSSNAREIGDFVTIGSGVVLDNAVELGMGAIIPAQDTIITMGKFGDKRRTVTLYGTDSGPRISVGCNVGVRLEEIRKNVQAHSFTTTASANAYAPYLEIFRTIGKTVQTAYLDHNKTVKELKKLRREIGMKIYPHE